MLCFVNCNQQAHYSHSGSNRYYLNGVLLTNNVNVLDMDTLYRLIYRTTRTIITSSTGPALFLGFASRNLKLMRKAFVTYIRTILE